MKDFFNQKITLISYDGKSVPIITINSLKSWFLETKTLIAKIKIVLN